MSVLSMLGNAANEYLWAHGYQPKSVELIQRAYEESPEEFVQTLAAAGMALAEAQYLYNLITR